MKFEHAYPLAADCVRLLKPHCDGIQIAGSLSRRKPDVKDIEIVALPRILPDMFGDLTHGTNLLAAVLDQFAADWGWHSIKGGDRYRQYTLPQGIKLDLFMVIPPAQWGVILTIRTGPAGFSHRLVTPRKHGGLLPSNLRVKDGAIWNGKEIVPTPTEQDVFNLLGIDYIEPQNRK